jgi:hypothetical protein
MGLCGLYGLYSYIRGSIDDLMVYQEGLCSMQLVYRHSNNLEIRMQDEAIILRLIYGSFKSVEGFKHLGTTLTDQNPTHEEIKNRLKSWNASYHSVQNLMSSSL